MRVFELLKRTGAAAELLSDPELGPSRLRGHGRGLVCRACGATVTSEAQRLAIEGRSVHHRINPAGMAFEFGCFRQAPGATAAGQPTEEYSWFQGYTWVYSLCRGCTTHLGWRFEGRQPTFHALILNRLAAEDSPDDTPGN